MAEPTTASEVKKVFLVMEIAYDEKALLNPEEGLRRIGNGIASFWGSVFLKPYHARATTAGRTEHSSETLVSRDVGVIVKACWPSRSVGFEMK